MQNEGPPVLAVNRMVARWTSRRVNVGVGWKGFLWICHVGVGGLMEAEVAVTGEGLEIKLA